MISRFHYDQQVFRRFLNDELSVPKEREVQTHVEHCAACQTALESISQDDIDWDTIPRLFVRDHPHHSANAMPRAYASFLQESTHPNSLGRFGRYEIVEYLGCGGMGLVLKGFDPALNRYSAIKVLAPVLATSASARQRFAREAKSAAAVVHEHVVPIQTVDEENGVPYLVMPVVEGKSLQQRVDQTGPLELEEILRIGMQIASGLAAAHAQGLVHRDVKPANVLLENGVERVMLTDFGLARAADDAHMTQSGVITGTPQYMSPEQAQGSDIDQKSDLFSLGSVLYFMCTGHSPFRAKTTFGVLNRIITDPHRPVRKTNAAIPEWMQTIIDRLLAKDKAQRFASAAEVAQVLAGWLAHLQQPDVVDKPSTPRGQKYRVGRGHNVTRGLLVVAGAFLVLFASVFITIELGKGTLTIECAEDGVPIRIIKGDKVQQKLTIDRGVTTTRITAGNYVVEIDGPSDGLEVQQGAITLHRGGAALAKIVQSPTAQLDLAKDGEKNKLVDDTRIEFIENTDIFVVRGRKKNVERVMELVDQPSSLDTERETQARARRPMPDKAGSPGSLPVIPPNSIVFLEADWCATCAVMAQTIDQLIEEGCRIVRIDVGQQPQITAKFSQKSIPSLIVFRDGKEESRREGPMSNDSIRKYVVERPWCWSRESVNKPKSHDDVSYLDYRGAWPQHMYIRVIDKDGNPVKNAVVFRNHVYRSIGSRPTKIEDAKFDTDAEGRTTIILSGPPVDLRIWVRKEGYAPLHAMWAVEIQSDGNRIPREFTFVLERGTTIGGKVVDESGRPIEGAMVEVKDTTVDYSVSATPRPGERPKRAYDLAEGNSVMTDEKGMWTLNNVPTDAVLEAGRRDIHPTRSDFNVPSPGAPMLSLRIKHPQYKDHDWGDLQIQQQATHESLRDRTATLVLKKATAK